MDAATPAALNAGAGTGYASDGRAIGENFDGLGLVNDIQRNLGQSMRGRRVLLTGAGRIADGVGMLVEQAAEAFAWWRGVRPGTGLLIAKLTVPLA